MITTLEGHAADMVLHASPTEVAALQAIVPGALVYGYPPNASLSPSGWGRRRVRFDPRERRADPWGGRGQEPDQSRVVVPIAGAYLVDDYCEKRGIGVGYIRLDDLPPIDRAQMAPDAVAAGRARLAELEAAGQIKQGWAERVYPMQAELVGLCHTHGYKSMVLVWPGGAGKTVAGWVSALASRAPALFVVPSCVRPGWGRDMRMISDEEIFVCMPKSSGGGGEALIEYLERREAAGKPPLVVVGMEGIAGWYSALCMVPFESVYFDEVDELAPTDTQDVINRADGTTEYRDKRTTKRNRLKRGTAIRLLARLPSVKQRFGITATPIWSGVPTKMWAVADLVWPDVFGSRFTFMMRHCGGRVGEMGYMEYPEATHTRELIGRSTFFFHHVEHEESHKGLPPITHSLRLVRKEDQDKGAKARYSDDLTWNQAIRKRAMMEKARKGGAEEEEEDKASTDNSTIENTSSYELALHHACALKRKTIVGEASRRAVAGELVVVAVGRKQEAEEWTDAIRTTIKRKTPDGLEPARVWLCSGSVTPDARYAAIDEWAADGAGVLVITIQAMGKGVDGMQAAHHAIVGFIPQDSRALEQLIKRFDRQGRLYSGSVDIYAAEGSRDMSQLAKLADGYEYIHKFLGEDHFNKVKKMLAQQDTSNKDPGAAFLAGIDLSWMDF